jgi:Malate/L-lactate dehydrogenase
MVRRCAKRPLSFALHGRTEKIAFLIDQSSSAVAWTDLKRAAEDGQPIPLGLALEMHGAPTTDPVEGPRSSAVPFGSCDGWQRKEAPWPGHCALPQPQQDNMNILEINGGEGGIRTPGTFARTPHFECGAIDHSATSPHAGVCGSRAGR